MTTTGRSASGASDALAPETATVAKALTQEVLQSFDHAPERLRTLMQSLVGHLHTFVLDNDLTEAEWRYAIDFLTRAGHITSDTRQEFILLSDTLGVSSLVDLLTNSRTPESTPSAVLGPFYVEGPPDLPDGTDISGGHLDGDPVLANITVNDLQGRPIPGAVVDVWQANQDGFYDVQLPDLEGPVLRGRLRTDTHGHVSFWTILPAPYPIPDDGPVGQMLAAAGRHPMRAPHIHFMIAAPEKHTLVTQLFVEGGDYLGSDTVFGVKAPLTVPFPVQDDPPADGHAAHWRRLDFIFNLADQT
ncbi:MAG: alcohol dehydrogenase [Propionibacteriaceae bacterium]|jgi:maleylacetate reductase|nr:alcohol dehydrogenase [Propionibacteriaceae bacterium]